ncbi:hypothetical protein SARC_13045 [Sphaeroforma arctica JP610]|uniref:Rieske domain-containing protein n=1 Tax=Sphaeroforma arctica JP610 TaxID=667725 RepID=A0A0L0FEA2_9EUKA|nr:hypothetical protein SARC_13045 [Sphaeroforma arctica JP610]KNC74408.1 hypothetical protein SARC_13045 [Sphaeroforma arctica JP610]|eukprot:XP_014148310.1 hypothetical protein SARC_13045 [Sphaeroforma arctica JP610]
MSQSVSEAGPSTAQESTIEGVAAQDEGDKQSQLRFSKEERKAYKLQHKQMKERKKAQRRQLEDAEALQRAQVSDLLANGSLSTVPYYYKDDVKTDELLSTLALHRNWTEVQQKADVRSLYHNRLYTVGDLRSLSTASWDTVELLPLVKDLLRRAIELRCLTPLPVFERLELDDSSASSPGVSDMSILTAQSQSASVGGRSHSSALIGWDKYKRLAQAQRFGKDAMSQSSRRMTVQDGGKTYEVDRYCPHKNVDMKGMPVRNGVLTCTKHDWRFDLRNGGMCARKGKSVNAVCLAADPKLAW